MNMITISLSAQAVSPKAVKKAKAVLKVASVQERKVNTLTYKESVKALTSLRRERDKVVGELNTQIKTLSAKLSKENAKYDTKIQRAIQARDKAAEKAGVITTSKVQKSIKPEVKVKAKSKKPLAKKPSTKSNPKGE
jgi:hypothetical protein